MTVLSGCHQKELLPLGRLKCRLVNAANFSEVVSPRRAFLSGSPVWRQHHLPERNRLLPRPPGGVPQLPGLCVERPSSTRPRHLHQLHRAEHRAHLRLHHRLVGAAASDLFFRASADDLCHLEVICFHDKETCWWIKWRRAMPSLDFERWEDHGDWCYFSSSVWGCHVTGC